MRFADFLTLIALTLVCGGVVAVAVGGVGVVSAGNDLDKVNYELYYILAGSILNVMGLAVNLVAKRLHYS